MANGNPKVYPEHGFVPSCSSPPRVVAWSGESDQSQTKQRYLRWCYLGSLNTVLGPVVALDMCFVCLVSIFVALYGHTLPFRESAALHLTVFVWRSAIALLVLATLGFCASFILLQLSCRGVQRLWRDILCSSVPLLVVMLLVGNALLAWSYVHYFSMEQNWGPGHNGFLKLCVVWCEFNVWDACYNHPSVARSSLNASAAVDFYDQHILGRVKPGVVTASVYNREVLVLYHDGTGQVCKTDTLHIRHASHVDAQSREGALLLGYGCPAHEIMMRMGWSTLDVSGSSWAACAMHGIGNAGLIASNAAILNAVAEAAWRSGWTQVSVYGCSYGGKIAFAAALVSPTPYSNVFLDSGGAMGPASLKVVGRCGEPLQALLGRRKTKEWLSSSVHMLSAPKDWPYDTGDLMAAKCRSTNFTIAMGQDDLWNNPLGTAVAVQTAWRSGCGDTVKLIAVPGSFQHCEFFDELFT